jgi:uncharacterized membrane protein
VMNKPSKTEGLSGVRDNLSDRISRNIESVAALEREHLDAAGPSQRRLERISRFIARPWYLVLILAFAMLWMVLNTLGPALGFISFDPPPYPWLEGLLSLIALLTTTVVLIAQNRQGRLEQQRSHLALQVTMLTEQKATHLIHLMEELRRDLPMVRDRHDPQAHSLQTGADAAEVVIALREGGLGPEEKDAPDPKD